MYSIFQICLHFAVQRVISIWYEVYFVYNVILVRFWYMSVLVECSEKNTSFCFVHNSCNNEQCVKNRHIAFYT